MENYNGIGKDLIEEGIFERFPQLTPKGGDNYWSNNHYRLLLVGESNYFQDELESISNFKVAEKWYYGDKNRLIPESKEKDVNNWIGGGKFKRIFDSMKKVLEEKGVEYFKDDLLMESRYYNYFLRPAREYNKKGERDLGFKKDCEPLDCEVSYSALCGIIEKLEPKILIFVSKFSHDKFVEYCGKKKKTFKNIKIDFVYHFSSPRTWKHRNGQGQQKFENLLWEHWIIPIPQAIKEQSHQLFYDFEKNPFWSKGIWGEINWYEEKDATCAYFDNISTNIAIDVFCVGNDKYQFQVFERKNSVKQTGMDWIQNIPNLTAKGSRHESQLQSRQDITETLRMLMK